MIKEYRTKARPEPNNLIWEIEKYCQTYICERPQYHNKKLEREFLRQGFRNESLMIFGKILPFFFDKEGRWWAHPSLCSKELLQLFTKEPLLYVKTIIHKIQTTKEVIETLKSIDVYTEDIKKLKENFNTLSKCYVNFYSYHFITYIVSDELLLEFQTTLQKFLSKKEANVYLSEFLRAEITKEAIKRGAVGETLKSSRDLFYSEKKPILFYSKPKMFFDSIYDNDVIEKLCEHPELMQSFLSLRIIAPIVIQINEEAQYIENYMLMPIMKITLEKIQEIFVRKGFLENGTDIRNLSIEEIENRFAELIGEE